MLQICCPRRDKKLAATQSNPIQLINNNIDVHKETNTLSIIFSVNLIYYYCWSIGEIELTGCISTHPPVSVSITYDPVLCTWLCNSGITIFD